MRPRARGGSAGAARAGLLQGLGRGLAHLPEVVAARRALQAGADGRGQLLAAGLQLAQGLAGRAPDCWQRVSQQLGDGRGVRRARLAHVPQGHGSRGPDGALWVLQQPRRLARKLPARAAAHGAKGHHSLMPHDSPVVLQQRRHGRGVGRGLAGNADVLDACRLSAGEDSGDVVHGIHPLGQAGFQVRSVDGSLQREGRGAAGRREGRLDRGAAAAAPRHLHVHLGALGRAGNLLLDAAREVREQGLDAPHEGVVQADHGQRQDHAALRGQHAQRLRGRGGLLLGAAPEHPRDAAGVHGRGRAADVPQRQGRGAPELGLAALEGARDGPDVGLLHEHAPLPHLAQHRQRREADAGIGVLEALHHVTHECLPLLPHLAKCLHARRPHLRVLRGCEPRHVARIVAAGLAQARQGHGCGAGGLAQHC
mmetsp:Transcript_86768/g.280953  ORF Transcript_86768/g.280953 Transcript_86768/m.280953 type:complete len:424 (-) Transcript_86768:318-1589(-)